MRAFPSSAAPSPSTGWFGRLPLAHRLLIASLILAGIAGPDATLRAEPATTGQGAGHAASSNPADQIILLIPVLTGEGSPTDRRAAAVELLNLRSEEAVKALARILTLKNNSAAKLAICDAVADMDTPPAALAEPLMALLQGQKEQALHDTAVAALYRFTDLSVTGRLQDYLEQEELQWLRAETAARSRELYALLPKESDRVARLLVWLKAAQPVDRLTALEIVHSAMLATTPVPPAKEVLQQIRVMLRDPDERVRQKLVVVLRDLQEKEDVTRILGMLDHERSSAVLEEIYKALGRMGDPESIKAGIKGLNHPDDKVAAGAADALGRLCRKGNGRLAGGAETAVTALLARAAKPMSDDLRVQIIGAMADIADPRFLDVLTAGAGKDERLPQVRQAALTGVGQIGDSEQVSLVIARLSDDADPGVREAAAQALGLLGRKMEHLRPLLAHLAEPSQGVQARAWEAYRAIFARLAWAERLDILSTWTNKDKAGLARRVDLLTDLETQAITARLEPKQLTAIRQQLGDALFGRAEYALAATAYARAVEGLATDQTDERVPIVAKLMDAYLRVPAYDKAVTLAAAAQSPLMRGAISEKLLAHAQELLGSDPRGAAECVNRFKTAVPALFDAEWGSRFESLRRSATQPSATTPAK